MSSEEPKNINKRTSDEDNMEPKELKNSNEERMKHKCDKDNKDQVPEKRSRLDYLDETINCPGSGLRSSFHGSIYQLKLLMLFVIRGLNLNLRFRLGTEFKPCDKYDDVFFEYENENRDGSIIRLVQVKHKQDNNKTISLNDLLTETDGEFSLQKYFISYRKIIKHPVFTRKNTEIKDFIIYTNIDFHENLKKNFEPVKGSDVILDMNYDGKDAKRLKFKNDFSIRSTIELIFKNSSESCRLAKKIATLDTLDLKDELLKTYHGVLAKDVFKITDDAKDYSTFCDSFLHLSDNNKTKELILLRNNVFSYLKKKEKFDELKNKKIPTSRSFGKVFEPNNNPEIKNSDQFVTEFANLVKLAPNNIVQLSRANRNIKENINKLAGYLLIKKADSENDIYFLSSAFFDDNCPLPAELTTVRSNLKATFEKKGIVVKKDEFKFKITKFHTCYDGEHNTKVKESLPDDCVTDEEIKGFLNKLVFAVNQPNEVELGKIIAKEILADVNLIVEKFQSYMLDWMKKEKGTFLTFDDAKKFFEEAKCEQDAFLFVGPTFDYLAKMDPLGLSFHKDAINELQKYCDVFLNQESKNQILNIFTEHTHLCSIKIYQIIKEFANYKTNRSYIFLELSIYVRLLNQLLLNSNKFNLLIIVNNNAKTDNDNYKKDLLNLIKYLKQYLNENSKMKIIIIGSSEKTFLNCAEFSTDKFEDKNLNLTDLTLESENKIHEEGIVSFQGQKVSLDKLLNRKFDNKIDANILSKLIHKQEIKIGAVLPNLSKDYYITRTLKYCVNINPDIQKDTQSFFFVHNYERYKNNERMPVDEVNLHQDIILISDISDNEFKDFCTENPKKNIHWLKNNEGKLIWKQSYGDNLSKLREFIDTNSPQFTVPKTVTDIKEKVVIIVAEPGMGKSTLLTHLALETKKLEPTLYILRINLLDNVEQLKLCKEKRMKTRTLTESDIKDFLFSCLSKKTNEESMTALERNVFYYCYQEGKLIVMMDGFDEIILDYKKIVIKILKLLKNSTIKGLWITTRLYNIQSEIENVLNTFSYSLQPISKENQISFLKSYWTQNLKVPEIDDALITEFLKWFSKITNDENGDFRTIPLQLKMIAEIFQNKFKDKLFNNYKQMFGENLNLVILYEKFIDHKFYKILMQDLNKDQPQIKQMIEKERAHFISNHKKFALLSLFGTVGLNMLNIDIGSIVSDINLGKDMAGIIDRVINDKPIFIHKSYAEYFAALWMADNWNENNVKTFLREYLFKEENNMIRKFFDTLLAYENNPEDVDCESENSEEFLKDNVPTLKNKYKLHVAILNNDLENIINMFASEIGSLDEGGRTAIHLIASYNYTEIWNLINFEELNFDIAVEDKLFVYAPLIYAEKCGSWKIADSLLEAGANSDDMYKEIDSINDKYEGPNNPDISHCNMTLLHIAADQGLLYLTKVLLEKGSDVNARDKNGCTALHLAAEKGKTEIVKLVMKSLETSKLYNLLEYLNEKDREERTALHIALMFKHPEIVKILINYKANVVARDNQDTVIPPTAR